VIEQTAVGLGHLGGDRGSKPAEAVQGRAEKLRQFRGPDDRVAGIGRAARRG
jgi:hypothetical protein